MVFLRKKDSKVHSALLDLGIKKKPLSLRVKIITRSPTSDSEKGCLVIRSNTRNFFTGVRL